MSDEAQAAGAGDFAPLAVDLDGTLIRADLFGRAVIKLVATGPWQVPLVLARWWLKGRAALKAKLAEQFPCDPATLPYDERLVDWLGQQRAEGRILALATAWDIKDAQRVARHLLLFDYVLASDGRVNLKGEKKAARLAALFAVGFSYAGNEWADLHVWRRARSAVIVNAPDRLVRRVCSTYVVERIFPRR